MARKQVLIQIDDELLSALDRRVRRSKTNRSALIRQAVAEHLVRLDRAEKDRLMVEGYKRLPEDSEESEALGRAALAAWPEW